MVALPFVNFKRKVNKPMPKSYPKKPMTIGEHLRKKRMELRLLQCDLADILRVSEDCITNWENNKSIPQINYYPGIQLFLGYSPLTFDESNFGGKLKAYRWKNGLSHKRLGKILGVNSTTIGAWEAGESVPKKENLEQLELLLKGDGFGR